MPQLEKSSGVFLYKYTTMFDPWQQSKLNSGIAKMKEYTVNAPDVESIDDLKRLAGVTSNQASAPFVNNSDKVQYERDNNIKPGTNEWFRLHFAKTSLTGETPHG